MAATMCSRAARTHAGTVAVLATAWLLLACTRPAHALHDDGYDPAASVDFVDVDGLGEVVGAGEAAERVLQLTPRREWGAAVADLAASVGMLPHEALHILHTVAVEHGASTPPGVEGAEDGEAQQLAQWELFEAACLQLADEVVVEVAVAVLSQGLQAMAQDAGGGMEEMGMEEMGGTPGAGAQHADTPVAADGAVEAAHLPAKTGLSDEERDKGSPATTTTTATSSSSPTPAAVSQDNSGDPPAALSADELYRQGAHMLQHSHGDDDAVAQALELLLQAGEKSHAEAILSAVEWLWFAPDARATAGEPTGADAGAAGASAGAGQSPAASASASGSGTGGTGTGGTAEAGANANADAPTRPPSSTSNGEEEDRTVGDGGEDGMPGAGSLVPASATVPQLDAARRAQLTKRAWTLLRSIADKRSNMDAQLYVANAFLAGFQIAVDEEANRGYDSITLASAINMLQTAARAKAPLAMLAMGYRYQFGLGVPESCRHAARYLLPLATEATAIAAESGSDGMPAVRLWEVWEDPAAMAATEDVANTVQYESGLAEEGDVVAQETMGMLYLHGNPVAGIAPDPAVAAQHFRAAAAQGSAIAHSTLGLLHSHGIGVEQDTNAALRHLNEAADLGDTVPLIPPFPCLLHVVIGWLGGCSQNANNGLGVMYMNGEGVDVNASLAEHHFRVAIEDGNAQAHNNLGILFLQGSGMDVNTSAARFHFKQAADAGFMAAMLNMGRLELYGWDGPRNCSAALPYLRLAATRSSFIADGVLSSDVAFNHFMAGRHEHALRVYAMLAQLGHGTAQDNAAFLFDRGVGKSDFGGFSHGLAVVQDPTAPPSATPDAGATAAAAGAAVQSQSANPTGDTTREPGTAVPQDVSEAGHHGDSDSDSSDREGDATRDDVGKRGDHEAEAATRWTQWANAQSFSLYSSAAVQDVGRAARRVGDCFFEGWAGACEVNQTRAVEWYTRATQLLDGQAAFELAALHLRDTLGEGVPANLSRASELLEQVVVTDPLGGWPAWSLSWVLTSRIIEDSVSRGTFLSDVQALLTSCWYHANASSSESTGAPLHSDEPSSPSTPSSAPQQQPHDAASVPPGMASPYAAELLTVDALVTCHVVAQGIVTAVVLLCVIAAMGILGCLFLRCSRRTGHAARPTPPATHDDVDENGDEDHMRDAPTNTPVHDAAVNAPVQDIPAANEDGEDGEDGEEGGGR